MDAEMTMPGVAIQQEARAPGPLAGIRVIDWTIYGVGPFATSLLAALGADVVKVERPPVGDPQLLIGPFIDRVATLYLNFNTGKRSIHLAVDSEAGRAALRELIRSGDILVTNFRPGAIDKLGFTAETIAHENPHLIHVDATGWGNEGPMARLGAADTQIAAFSSWCSMNGEEGGRWEQIRFAGHLDMTASLYVAAAAVTGLLGRARSGRRVLKVSMLESALAMLSSRLSEYLLGGVVPQPLGSAHSVYAPDGMFQCQEGSYIAVTAETEEQWLRLCSALGREDLTGAASFRTNRDRVLHRAELVGELGKSFAERPTMWWELALTRAKVPHAKLWDWDDIRHHPQVRSNEHLVELDTGRCGTVYTGGPPWKFDESACRITRNPYSGEHTKEVLAESAVRVPKPQTVVSLPEASVRSLEGLKVLELASGIAGPYCGACLADEGATVVKVETHAQDYARSWQPPTWAGCGTAFVEVNRNKVIRRVASGHPAADAGVAQLLAEADVVIVDSFAGDGSANMPDLRAWRQRRPELTICSISPYGERGPLADVPGSELTVQAMTNCWAGLGERGSPPLRLGADQASMSTGILAYIGILAALVRRQETGRGDYVSLSLLGTMLAIKGMHWVSLSNPDDWPGAHLKVWTDPPHYGVNAADAPVTFTLARGVGLVDGAATEAILAELDVKVPPGMDLKAPWTSPASPMAPTWKGFWASVFGDRRSADLAEIFRRAGCDLIPWNDAESLRRHPQVEAITPFVKVVARDASSEDRIGWVARLPWRHEDIGSTYQFDASGQSLDGTGLAWSAMGEMLQA